MTLFQRWLWRGSIVVLLVWFGLEVWWRWG